MTLPLSEDTEVTIEGVDGGENLLVIQDGTAKIESASCPDGICVRHYAISRDGESIICLPNRVVVTIRGGEKGDVDALYKNDRTARIVLYGMMIALAFVFSYLEHLIPLNIGIPGIKLGLGNLVVLIALYTLGTGGAFVIAVVRIVLTGLTFGGLFSMLYSLAGGLLSFVVMALLSRSGRLHIAGVSICGGVMHNIGQLAVAMLVLEDGECLVLSAGSADFRSGHRSGDRDCRRGCWSNVWTNTCV